MSKKNRTQRRKRSAWRYIAWIYIVAGILGLVLLVWVVTSFRSTPASLPPVSGGTPVASVASKLIDWGDLKDFTNKTISITVTNTGTGMLSFSEKPYIQVLEGCCPPDLSVGKMTLRPGESTKVTSAEFYMHPGMDGKHNYAVHLKTNDPTQPDLVVNVLSNWSQ
jgi:hypothetical protein